MTTIQPNQPQQSSIFSQEERSRLLRFCTRLTSDPMAADDLVQETLLTAWQRLDQLTDPSGISAWLATIAHNHYLHWLRSRSRRQKYVVADEHAINKIAITDIDLLAEWDSEQFVHLLDRAMADLPAETQTLLVQHYLNQIPQSELAAQMGMNSGAIAGRLHRGKKRLQRLLVTKFSDDSLALGLIPLEHVGWQSTRIWCSACGQRKLDGKFISGGNGQLLLRCDCGANHGIYGPADLLSGVHGYRPALTRGKQWQHTLLGTGLRNGMVECPCCSHTARVQLASPTAQIAPEASSPADPTIHVGCTACTWQLHIDLAAFAGSFPTHIHFGRQHPRVKTLPIHQINFHGAPALIVSTQAITTNAQLDLIFHAHTFALLDTVIQ